MKCFSKTVLSVAALSLVALAGLAHANTSPGNQARNMPALKPQIGTLAGLTISGATGGTTANGPFKTTDTLSATVTGAPGAKCGIAITSSATFAQPVAFAVEGSKNFPQTRTFQNLKVGSQTVVAKPTAGPDFPACLGNPITVNFVVVQ